MTEKRSFSTLTTFLETAIIGVIFKEMGVGLRVKQIVDSHDLEGFRVFSMIALKPGVRSGRNHLFPNESFLLPPFNYRPDGICGPKVDHTRFSGVHGAGHSRWRWRLDWQQPPETGYPFRRIHEPFPYRLSKPR